MTALWFGPHAPHQRACQAALTPDRLDDLAARLGLPDPSPLARLGLGWDAAAGTYTFPERDDGGDVVGLWQVGPDGRGRPGPGRRGLFLATGLGAGRRPILVAEGPVDTARLLAAGMAVVGRPVRGGGGRALGRILADLSGRIVVIGRAGRAGPAVAADRLVRGLQARVGRRVTLVAPPPGGRDVRSVLSLLRL